MRRPTVLLFALALLLGACRDGSPSRTDAGAAASSSTTIPRSATTATLPVAGPCALGPQAPPTATLTADFATALAFAPDGRLFFAERSGTVRVFQDGAVRQFATTMITDHTAVNAQAAALTTRLGVTPKDNAVSQSLQSDAAQARSSLEPLHGRAFDRGYIDREVAYHQAVLDAIDKLLIPTTENAELRKLLVAVRPAVAAHLEHAKHVRRQLGAPAWTGK